MASYVTIGSPTDAHLIVYLCSLHIKCTGTTQHCWQQTSQAVTREEQHHQSVLTERFRLMTNTKSVICFLYFTFIFSALLGVQSILIIDQSAFVLCLHIHLYFWNLRLWKCCLTVKCCQKQVKPTGGDVTLTVWPCGPIRNPGKSYYHILIECLSSSTKWESNTMNAWACKIQVSNVSTCSSLATIWNEG